MGEGKSNRHRCAAIAGVIKKLTIALFVLFAAVSFIYVIGDMFSPLSVPSITHERYLGNVGQLDYDCESGRLVWGKVRNATYYLVEADGMRFAVYTNEWYCDQPITEFRVKAVDSTGKYGDSLWSYLTVDIPN